MRENNNFKYMTKVFYTKKGYNLQVAKREYSFSIV
jgi:hypothetical protein